MNDQWHIAQLNVATARYQPDSPEIAEFYARLDEINRLADTSPGFIWRLQSESGNATDIEVDGDPLVLVNMSVWSSIEALYEFVYRTAHRDVMAKRRQWFQRPDSAYQVLWWLPVGHTPTVEDGYDRLRKLRGDGPTPQAFNFQVTFPAPGDTGGTPESFTPEQYCAGWD